MEPASAQGVVPQSARRQLSVCGSLKCGGPRDADWLQPLLLPWMRHLGAMLESWRSSGSQRPFLCKELSWMWPGVGCHRTWLRMHRWVSMRRVRRLCRLLRALHKPLLGRDSGNLPASQIMESLSINLFWPHVMMTEHKRGGSHGAGLAAALLRNPHQCPASVLPLLHQVGSLVGAASGAVGPVQLHSRQLADSSGRSQWPSPGS